MRGLKICCTVDWIVAIRCYWPGSAAVRHCACLRVVGAGGTAGEIIAAARLEPQWSFLAVDPSPPMLDLDRVHLAEAGATEQVETVLGVVGDVDPAPAFDAAIMIGVLHHQPGDAAKKELLDQVAVRLRPTAPFVIAGNYRAYASQPLLMAAWANRWRMNGVAPEEVQAKMNKILQGAEPSASEEAVFALLAGSGFGEPTRFFTSVFCGAWLTQRNGRP